MNIELEIEKLSTKFDHMSGKVDKMYDLLVGSEFDENTGYISKIQKLEATVKELSDFKQKMIWIGIGVAIPSGMGLAQIVNYILGIK